MNFCAVALVVLKAAIHESFGVGLSVFRSSKITALSGIQVQTKDAPGFSVDATIEEAARGLGITTHHPDGLRKIGGHSLRVAGAQSLSRAGFDAWSIGLLAR